MALILKERKNTIPNPRYWTTFKTDSRMWHHFVCWGLQIWPKMRWMLDNKFVLTPCIINHFPMISQKNCNIFLMAIFFPKTKIIINSQTFQYEHLKTNFNLSCLGIFQYVRVILQVSLSLDHPVPKLDGVSLLQADPHRWSSTTRQSTANSTWLFSPILWLKNQAGIRMSLPA